MEHGPVDLNADLGEGFGRWQLTDDQALLSVVTSANVACGFHAGDPSTMRRVCELAVERGVRIGARFGGADHVHAHRAGCLEPAVRRPEWALGPLVRQA